jgi:putative molybdopterin biosynthesis protein
MSIYLHDIPLDEAQRRLRQALIDAGLDGVLGHETLALDETLCGRTLAEPVWARLSSPHYHASAMDGFAVRARETDGALETAPISLVYGTETSYVDTGDPLPEWANAVIPIEAVEPLGREGDLAADPRRPYAIRIRASVPPWKHVRPMGEDMVASQLVLPAGHTLRPVDLGAIAGSGHDRVTVARRPRVAVIPTGSELKAVGEPVGPGDIIEYNAMVLAAQVREWGGDARRFAITPDEPERLRAAVLEAAAAHDLILLNAGSSAGSEDYSAQVVTELGDLLVHGVAVRPGHPVILGLIRRPAAASVGPGTVPIIGVPGYPVSAALTGEIFVEPLLARWQGRQPAAPLMLQATLTRKTTSPGGDDDYVRVAVGRVGDRFLAAPLTRGAGVISSLVRADGLVLFPRGSQGLPAGAEVDVRLYRSPGALTATILAIGSHDMTLDLLAQFLAGKDRRLSSANVGSLGGLIALRRGEAHLAGSHLLDPETGEYNVRYVRDYLPGQPVVLVTLVGREQGLLVPAGNPKALASIADLTRADVTIVNRQRGAGTRVLLDYALSRAGLETAAIRGYDQEEYTHLAVAAAVRSGRADCGLGIAAAAQALGLAFVPLFQERYDLVIPQQHYEDRLLEPLLETLHEAAFRQAVAALPGYDVSAMGSVVAKLGPDPSAEAPGDA